MLDRQVRDAAARIELVRRGDRARRADLDAARARAATVGDRFIRRQGEIGEDLAEEEHRAGILRQQQRVLAAPAEARLARQFHLEHRRGVRRDAVAERSHGLLDALGQRLQSAAQHLVIVAATRVERHHCGIGILEATQLARGPVERSIPRQVVHAHRDGAAGARQQARRVCAQRGMPLHVIHVAVATGREPRLQPLGRLGQVEIGDADLGKAELRAPGAYLCCERSDVRRGAGMLGAIRFHASHSRCRTQSRPCLLRAPWRRPPTPIVSVVRSPPQRASTCRRSRRHGLQVNLSGDLGSGKTALVRGWLRALGIAGPVRSPDLHRAGALRRESGTTGGNGPPSGA